MTSRQDLENIDPPHEFESIIADLWEHKGYETKVRQKSRDRGVDVEAKKGEYEEVIQVKRYSRSNKIGSQAIRNYATLYQQIPSTDSVVIVTSGEFTNAAQKLANDLNVETYNGERVLNEVKEFDMDIGLYVSNSNSEDQNSTGQRLDGKVQESETSVDFPRVQKSNIDVQLLSILQGDEIVELNTISSEEELNEHLESGNMRQRIAVVFSVTCLDSQIQFNTHKISFVSDEGYEYSNTSGFFTGYYEGGLDNRFSKFSDDISYKQTKNYICVSDTIPSDVSITGVSYEENHPFTIDFADQRDDLIENDLDDVL